MVHDLVDSASYMAHGYCLLWKPWLVVLHAGSDLLIFIAYFAIPVAIWIFLRQRKNLELKRVAVLFAAFIFLCGLTHAVQMVTLWWPSRSAMACSSATRACSICSSCARCFSTIRLWCSLAMVAKPWGSR
jgi:hypothetical protein